MYNTVLQMDCVNEGLKIKSFISVQTLYAQASFCLKCPVYLYSWELYFKLINLSLHSIFILTCTSIKFLCVYKYCLSCYVTICMLSNEQLKMEGTLNQPLGVVHRICFQRVMFNVLSNVLYVGQRTTEDGRYAQLAIGCCPSDMFLTSNVYVLSNVLYVGQRTTEDGKYAQLAIGCCPSDMFPTSNV